MPSSLPSAKKHWGQHFLQDIDICKEVVHLLGETASLSAVIEIGRGRGALTEWLYKE